MTAGVDADWVAYNDHQAGREVRPLCRKLIALAGDDARGVAIDFGCGAGVETRALLQAGWHVHAIDAALGTRDRILTTTAGRGTEQLTIDVRDFHDLAGLPPADLFYAGYSLPFIRPSLFSHVWRLVRTSLRPGAWLAVDLFGERDAWANDPEMTFFTEASARALLDGLAPIPLT
jgi:trans-aconitate methyltransferase